MTTQLRSALFNLIFVGLSVGFILGTATPSQAAQVYQLKMKPIERGPSDHETIVFNSIELSEGPIVSYRKESHRVADDTQLKSRTTDVVFKAATGEVLQYQLVNDGPSWAAKTNRRSLKTSQGQESLFNGLFEHSVPTDDILKILHAQKASKSPLLVTFNKWRGYTSISAIAFEVVPDDLSPSTQEKMHPLSSAMNLQCSDLFN